MDAPVDPPLARAPDWLSSAGIDDMRVLTIPQWCALNQISKSTGDRILKSGKGPKVVQLSTRRRGIRVIDNRKWQEAIAR
jgi:predicted DNA-binding transcriptional regulator AlpA